MKVTIHQIEFDLSDPTYAEATFRGGYRPSAGPLPTLHYPIVGLWLLDGLVIKAFFEATKVPTHDKELILHRYENARTSHQGQAKYRYFTVPGFAGMILSRPGYLANELRVLEVFHHLSKEVNDQKLKDWLASLPEEQRAQVRIEEVIDQVGGFAPIIVCIDESEPEPEPEPLPAPTPSGPVVWDADDDLPF